VKYVNDASQILFLVIAIVMVGVVIKVFFLEDRRKKPCALCSALYADKVAHQQFHDSLKS
jgi:disulfide bond formation protein DsbB